MKHIKLLFPALCMLAIGLGTISCKNDPQQVIDEYSTLVNQIDRAAKRHDKKEVNNLLPKAQKLSDKIKKYDLNEEQKADVDSLNKVVMESVTNTL